MVMILNNRPYSGDEWPSFRPGLRNAPAALFRHTKSRWAHELLQGGSIILNSLRVFGNEALTNRGRLDAREAVGTEASSFNPADGTTESQEKAIRAFRDVVIHDGDNLPSGDFNSAQFHVPHEDIFAYCLSESPSPEIGRRLSADNDCCVKLAINDAIATGIASALASAASYPHPIRWSGDRISYMSSRHFFDPTTATTPPLAFVKELLDEYQQEYRLAFALPLVPSTMKFNLCVPELIGQVEIIPY